MMSLQQRERVEQVLRDSPFDLGGDASVQRPLFEQMLTSQPLPDDVLTTPGMLGTVPVVFVDIAGVRANGVVLHLHGGGYAVGSARAAVGLAAQIARRAGVRVVVSTTGWRPNTPSRRLSTTRWPPTAPSWTTASRPAGWRSWANPRAVA